MKLKITIDLDDSKLHDENGYFDAVPEILRVLSLIDSDSLQENEIEDGDRYIKMIIDLDEIKQCDECNNIFESKNEIYYAPDADLCAWCHQKKYGDDKEGNVTFLTSQKKINNNN